MVSSKLQPLATIDLLTEPSSPDAVRVVYEKLNSLFPWSQVRHIVPLFVQRNVVGAFLIKVFLAIFNQQNFLMYAFEAFTGFFPVLLWLMTFKNAGWLSMEFRQTYFPISTQTGTWDRIFFATDQAGAFCLFLYLSLIYSWYNVCQYAITWHRTKYKPVLDQLETMFQRYNVNAATVTPAMLAQSPSLPKSTISGTSTTSHTDPQVNPSIPTQYLDYDPSIPDDGFVYQACPQELSTQTGLRPHQPTSQQRNNASPSGFLSSAASVEGPSSPLPHFSSLSCPSSDDFSSSPAFGAAPTSGRCPETTECMSDLDFEDDSPIAQYLVLPKSSSSGTGLTKDVEMAETTQTGNGFSSSLAPNARSSSRSQTPHRSPSPATTTPSTSSQFHAISRRYDDPKIMPNPQIAQHEELTGTPLLTATRSLFDLFSNTDPWVAQSSIPFKTSLTVLLVFNLLAWFTLNIDHFFSTDVTNGKDFLAFALYVGGHAAAPISIAVYLYIFQPSGALLGFSCTLGLQNLAGVWTHLFFPTTPPWYDLIHAGEIPTYDMPGYTAGLSRILERWGQLTSEFNKNLIPFGACPSLHSAIAFQAMLFTLFYVRSRIGRGIAVTYVVLQWWATMYLDHHWRMDLLVGLIYSLTAFTILLPFLLYVDTRYKKVRYIDCDSTSPYFRTLGMRIFQNTRFESYFDPHYLSAAEQKYRRQEQLELERELELELDLQQHEDQLPTSQQHQHRRQQQQHQHQHRHHQSTVTNQLSNPSRDDL